MKKNKARDFEIKWFFDSFEVQWPWDTITVSKEILKNLEIPSDLVFWKESDDSYILFSREKRNEFIAKATKMAWFTKDQFHWGVEWQRFWKSLFRQATPVSLDENWKMIFWEEPFFKEKINKDSFSVTICF